MPHVSSITGLILGLLAKPYGVPQLSGGSAVIVAHTAAPFASAYPWTDQVGYGTKYADPGTALPGQGTGVVFNVGAVQNTVFIASAVTPFLLAYAWSSAGFGTKFANMASIPSGTSCVGADCRSVAGETNYSIATCDNSGAGPYFGTWRFSKSGAGWGTKYAQPATLPANTGNAMNFSPSGGSLVCAHAASPFVSAWPFTSAGAGTKYADPASGPAASSLGSSFNTLGIAMALSHNFNASSKSISAWAWTDAAGFGTKYADSTTLPGGGSPAGTFARFLDSKAVAVGHGTNGTIGGVTAMKWTDAGGFGTVYGQISPLFAGQFNDGFWNLRGNTLFAATTILGFIRAQIWNDVSGFGSFYAPPATTPTGTGQRVAVAV